MYKIVVGQHVFITVLLASLMGMSLLILSDYYLYYIPILLMLFLVTIFIEKIERKGHLLLWSLLFFTPFLGGERSTEDILSQHVDPLRTLRIGIMVSFASIISVRMFLHKFRDMSKIIKGPLGWYLLYAFIAMLSAIYSPQPLVSLWKGFEIFVMIITAILMCEKIHDYKELRSFWSLNVIFLILLVGSSYVSVILSPSEALLEVKGIDFKQLYGVYPPINSNSLTQMAAIVISIFMVRHLFSIRNKLNFLLVLFAVPILIWAYGRTSILALFVTLTVIFILNRNYRHLFVLGAIALIVFWVDGYSYVKLFFEKGGSLYTISGRIYNWQTALELFKESPVYGHGFYVAPRIIFSEKMKIESFSTTDNTYFDILLSIGIIGFIPFAFMLFSFISNFYTIYKKSLSRELIRFRLEMLSVLIIILVRGLTGPSIQMLHWNLTLFLAIIICLMSLERLAKFDSLQNSERNISKSKNFL